MSDPKPVDLGLFVERMSQYPVAGSVPAIRYTTDVGILVGECDRLCRELKRVLPLIGMHDPSDEDTRLAERTLDLIAVLHEAESE